MVPERHLLASGLGVENMLQPVIDRSIEHSPVIFEVNQFGSAR